MAKILVELVLDSTRFGAQIGMIQNQLTKFAGSGGRRVNEMDQAMMGLTVTTGLLALGFERLTSAAVRAFSQMQLGQLTFQSFTKDVYKAKQAYESMLSFAARTPLQIEEIVRGTTMMLAFRLGTLDTAEALKMLQERLLLMGLAAKASNLPGGVEQIARAAADLKAGVIEIRQLAGLGVSRELLREYGLQFNKKGGLTSPGKEALEVFFQILEDRFGILAANVSETLAVKLSNIPDRLFIVFGRLGEAIYDEISPWLDKIFDWLDRIGEAIRRDPEAAAQQWRNVFQVFSPLVNTLDRMVESWVKLQETSPALAATLTDIAGTLGKIVTMILLFRGLAWAFQALGKVILPLVAATSALRVLPILLKDFRSPIGIWPVGGGNMAMGTGFQWLGGQLLRLLPLLLRVSGILSAIWAVYYIINYIRHVNELRQTVHDAKKEFELLKTATDDVQEHVLRHGQAVGALAGKYDELTQARLRYYRSLSGGGQEGSIAAWFNNELVNAQQWLAFAFAETVAPGAMPLSNATAIMSSEQAMVNYGDYINSLDELSDKQKDLARGPLVDFAMSLRDAGEEAKDVTVAFKDQARLLRSMGLAYTGAQVIGVGDENQYPIILEGTRPEFDKGKSAKLLEEWGKIDSGLREGLEQMAAYAKLKGYAPLIITALMQGTHPSPSAGHWAGKKADTRTRFWSDAEAADMLIFGRSVGLGPKFETQPDARGSQGIVAALAKQLGVDEATARALYISSDTGGKGEHLDILYPRAVTGRAEDAYMSEQQSAFRDALQAQERAQREQERLLEEIAREQENVARLEEEVASSTRELRQFTMDELSARQDQVDYLQDLYNLQTGLLGPAFDKMDQAQDGSLAFWEARAEWLRILAARQETALALEKAIDDQILAMSDDMKRRSQAHLEFLAEQYRIIRLRKEQEEVATEQEAEMLRSRVETQTYLIQHGGNATPEEKMVQELNLLHQTMLDLEASGSFDVVLQFMDDFGERINELTEALEQADAQWQTMGQGTPGTFGPRGVGQGWQSLLFPFLPQVPQLAQQGGAGGVLMGGFNAISPMLNDILSGEIFASGIFGAGAGGATAAMGLAGLAIAGVSMLLQSLFDKEKPMPVEVMNDYVMVRLPDPLSRFFIPPELAFSGALRGMTVDVRGINVNVGAGASADLISRETAGEVRRQVRRGLSLAGVT